MIAHAGYGFGTYGKHHFIHQKVFNQSDGSNPSLSRGRTESSGTAIIHQQEQQKNK